MGLGVSTTKVASLVSNSASFSVVALASSSTVLSPLLHQAYTIIAPFYMLSYSVRMSPMVHP